jgi:hypothetical protein
MQSAQVLVEQRKHPRAHLRLAARIRWQGPLGMRLEVTQTINVSREGLLLHRDEDSLALMSRVWIAFPFEPSSDAGAQPETPARIVRVDPEPDGGYRVGLQLQPAHRGTPPAGQAERRASSRVPFSLPIFVRPAETPWPEESMTRDFSRSGMRFETSHIYTVGEAVLAKIPWSEWANAGEISGRVVRVEPTDSQPAQEDDGRPTARTIFSCVAVEWNNQEIHSKPAAKLRRI